jgi:PPM family protein phosphatase
MADDENPTAPSTEPFVPEQQVVMLAAGACTNAGRVRSQNQDRYLVIENSLFIVADGMGGHVGGEVAAQITVDALATLAAEPEPLLAVDSVLRKVETANKSILQRSETEPDLRGMGTTVTGIAVVEGDDTAPALLLVVNVGDSRTYWLRNGELEQLSDDHSVVGELIREGKITATEARTHKSRSVLTRALGVEYNVECDVLEIVPIVGDRFLICSDGLPNELADPTIAAILRQLRDPQEAANELVREAVDHGGRDNVTVVVVDVVEGLDGHGIKPTMGTAKVPLTAVDHSAKNTKPIKATKPPKMAGPKTKRQPWIINLRVLAFLAALGAIAFTVVWTLRNAPTDGDAPVTVVSTTVTPATTEEPTTTIKRGKRRKRTATTIATIPAPTTIDISDPVPAATVSPLQTTTTSEPTTTTRKKK